MTQDLHIVCPHCEGINRVPNDKLESRPKCGKCGQALFDASPLALTENNFSRNISKNDIPVLVDFWAPWCGPCKMMAPVFTQAAAKLEPHIRLAKLNTEEQQHLAAQYQIRSIPTLAIFKNGREVARQPGAMDLGSLINWVCQHVLVVT